MRVSLFVFLLSCFLSFLLCAPTAVLGDSFGCLCGCCESDFTSPSLCLQNSTWFGWGTQTGASCTGSSSHDQPVCQKICAQAYPGKCKPTRWVVSCQATTQQVQDNSIASMERESDMQEKEAQRVTLVQEEEEAAATEASSQAMTELSALFEQEKQMSTEALDFNYMVNVACQCLCCQSNALTCGPTDTSYVTGYVGFLPMAGPFPAPSMANTMCAGFCISSNYALSTCPIQSVYTKVGAIYKIATNGTQLN